MLFNNHCFGSAEISPPLQLTQARESLASQWWRLPIYLRNHFSHNVVPKEQGRMLPLLDPRKHPPILPAVIKALLGDAQISMMFPLKLQFPKGSDASSEATGGHKPDFAASYSLVVPGCSSADNVPGGL